MKNDHKERKERRDAALYELAVTKVMRKGNHGWGRGRHAPQTINALVRAGFARVTHSLPAFQRGGEPTPNCIRLSKDGERQALEQFIPEGGGYGAE